MEKAPGWRRQDCYRTRNRCKKDSSASVCFQVASPEAPDAIAVGLFPAAIGDLAGEIYYIRPKQVAKTGYSRNQLYPIL